MSGPASFAPVAVTSATRTEALPDVPAVGEFLPGYEATTLYGFGAPKGTPVAVIEKLNREVNAALGDSKIQARMADLGGTALSDRPPTLHDWSRTKPNDGAKAATALVVPLSAPPSLAQPRYPSRPVRIIVPFAPGGGVDILARNVAPALSTRLRQQFYVENIAGAAGNIGTAHAARAAPDGYTVLFAFGSFVISPSLFAKAGFDPQNDFAPITLPSKRRRHSSSIRPSAYARSENSANTSKRTGASSASRTEVSGPKLTSQASSSGWRSTLTS